MPSDNSRHNRQSRGKASREWFRRAFAEDYLWLYAHRNEKEAFAQVNVARRLLPFMPGQKILDVACGAGRHILAFAKTGARVTGIDLSKTLVQLARKRIKEEGLKATVRQGDMRELRYKGNFDGATMWFTSLGYFGTIAEDQMVIDNLSRALKAGGWWWIDLPNPAYLENHLVPLSRRKCRGPHGPATVVERRKIVGRRVEKSILIMDSSGQRTYRESVRLYTPEQFGPLVKKARLTTSGILGDYDGRALVKEAPRQIWYGRKPD